MPETVNVSIAVPGANCAELIRPLPVAVLSARARDYGADDVAIKETTRAGRRCGRRPSGRRGLLRRGLAGLATRREDFGVGHRAAARELGLACSPGVLVSTGALLAGDRCE